MGVWNIIENWEQSHGIKLTANEWAVLLSLPTTYAVVEALHAKYAS